MQWLRLREMVSHAEKACHFYRTSWAGLGFESGNLKQWSDFRRLPVLSKSDISEHGRRMIADGFPLSDLHPKKTSGSTGVSLKFFVDGPCTQWRRGVTLYRDQWTGWRLGEYRGMIWGNPEYVKSWRGRLRNLLLELQHVRSAEAANDYGAHGVTSRRERPPAAASGRQACGLQLACRQPAPR